jgi:enterochelin esterase-like enzyme
MAELIPDPKKTNEQLKLIFVSCGDKDFILGVSQGVHRELKELKVPHTWHIDSGGHTREVWRNDLYLLSQLLFR